MTNSFKYIVKLLLHDIELGYLYQDQNGRNIFKASPEYRGAQSRYTLTASQLIDKKIFDSTWVSRQRLMPIFSNLLPEGAMRDWISQALKIHKHNEFEMFRYLGKNLPGALKALPIRVADLPEWIIKEENLLAIDQTKTLVEQKYFSLAGIQMKFSGLNQDGRFLITDKDTGNWILKTPSTIHRHVPANEYTAMSLAKRVGVDIPEIQFIDRQSLDGLPDINLPEENQVFVIKRFDRKQLERVHSEDFAQILGVYPEKKYTSANYEQMGRIIKEVSSEPLQDLQQLARRILVNALLGNGDAHIKNFSLYYPDKINPRLAPAYDILFTKAYIPTEEHFALNIGKNKNWYQLNYSHFENWSKKVGLPWNTIKVHLKDVIDQARQYWPQNLKELPMIPEHKQALQEHWGLLHEDFKI